MTDGDFLIKKVFDIHSIVDRQRENYVRQNHPFLSSDEIIKDYPQLPLTVAERRDVGAICDAHGREKNEVNQLPECIFDEKNPINIKLLSHLLRIADFFDASRDRISVEVLERNYSRMSKKSLFHWVKHLSVDDVKVVNDDEVVGWDENTKVCIQIIHNYIPFFVIPDVELQKICSIECKNKFKEAKKLITTKGKARLPEKYAKIKYLRKDICNVACWFINLSYKWFFTEIVYFNEYLKKKGISVEFDLSIIEKDNPKADFPIIYYREQKVTAQEFMVEFLHSMKNR